ncbi:conserved hypothetical protein [Pyrobaculum islandicum DSM 4184]|uniref:Uncharacterized protein n=1 Tax=Pyrobaculum islandicum (strain DSM 4184 / JCM 9189 / GEO3) TaxID=384616 RepID=A1RW27_PYRIL|nr:hypothetical protein [Pyrobaculum islandicum]ABL89159.1 conserved hypothetical protein [Pyrobaculum islandicum DSM 4184]
MVEAVEASIVEYKPAVAVFETPEFGKVTVRLIPIVAEIQRVGEGYNVGLVLKTAVEAERRVYAGLLCSQEIPLRPVPLEDKQIGRVLVRGEDGTVLEAYIEVDRVFVGVGASDRLGRPCVNVVWSYGIRMPPRG